MITPHIYFISLKIVDDYPATTKFMFFLRFTERISSDWMNQFLLHYRAFDFDSRLILILIQILIQKNFDLILIWFWFSLDFELIYQLFLFNTLPPLILSHPWFIRSIFFQLIEKLYRFRCESRNVKCFLNCQMFSISKIWLKRIDLLQIEKVNYYYFFI